MVDLALDDLRPFVAARDFALSRAFYRALGWDQEYLDDSLALLHNRGHRLSLQACDDKAWAGNSMLHIGVRDASACHAAIAALLADGRFPGARIAAPKREPYGALVTCAWDPSGVQLHLAAQWDPRHGSQRSDASGAQPPRRSSTKSQ